METVKNAFGSAFGSSNNPGQNETSGIEPVSGQTGAGTANDPFDKGNEDANATSEPSDTAPADPASSAKAEDRSTETPNASQSQYADSAKAEAENTASTSGNGLSASESSGGIEKPANEDERQEMAQRGELPKDPNDHSGEPMKMHDGSEHKEGGEDNKDQAEGEKQENDESKGTGEKWVKTSGMAADGGDFDAAKPGAGREANRLMEQKGVQKEDPSERGKLPVTTDADDKAGNGSKGPGPMEKLKEKLHIGTGKHGNQQSV